MKNIKIHLTKEHYEKTVTLVNASGQTLQDYMTIKALEILNIESNIKPEPEIRPSFQFRLDSTIHKLIEQKAKSLNKNVTELFEEVLK